MKKYLPIAISILLMSVILLLWDNIKIPYNENNLIIGQSYLNKLNPQNDTLRFILFVSLPCLAYLICYLKINNFSYNFKKDHKDFFLKKTKSEISDNSLNYYIFFFIILIIIEFCTIDFKKFIAIDLFHDSVFLTPPINYLNNGEFFKSTLYDYGFTGNNLGLIFNYFFGFYSLGAINFLKLILILSVKFFLILISQKITHYLHYDIFLKKVFFIFFTYCLLSLPNYYDLTSYFSPRSTLYLIFILLVGSALCEQKYKELKFFVVGVFSLISLFWWFDIGLYINFILILLGIYLFIYSKKKYLTFLSAGLFLSWLIFFIIIPSDEIKAFFYNLEFIISTTDYLIGIEYLKPFTDNSARWTKALLIIYFCSILLINLNFSKKINLNNNLKLFLNTIFISGIVIFKSALTRSDASHLKYSSGIYTIILIFIILFFIFYFVKNYNLTNNFINKMSVSLKERTTFILCSLLGVFFFLGVINYKNETSITNKINNIKNIRSNISNLINTKDIDYLKGNSLLAVKKYNELSKSDKCIQFFSDDNFFPYFLKKPTCTKFYLSNQIINGISEEDFISELSSSLPNYILFKSPKNIILKKNNFPTVIKYIEKNYNFHVDYNGYIFYKKKY